MFVPACGPGEDLTLPTKTDIGGETAAPPGDGRYFGYIRSIDLVARTLTIDLARFLTGDAADRAAAQAGEIEPGEHAPNDYFIDNGREAYVTVSLATDVVVRVVGRPPDLVDGDLGAFAAAFTLRPDQIHPNTNYRGVTSQYWVTVDEGVIVRVEEQYLP